MLPATIPHQLPQAKTLWQKFQTDLQSGFRLLGQHPDYMDVIRVWTKTTTHQFLLITRARQALEHPVGAIELHIYTSNSQSWKLHLIQHPFPQPHWQTNWQTLQDTYPIGQPDPDIQNQIINHYLASQFDPQTTHESFQTFLSQYQPERLQWVSRKT